MSFLQTFYRCCGADVGCRCPHGRSDAQRRPHTFRVFVRGVDTGIEEVTVLESADGWTLRGSGKLRAPLNLAIDYWEARYDRAWKPIELTVNLTESAKQWTVHTTFSGTIASSDISQDGQIQRRSSTIAADTVVLPNLIFGAYEALAARLATAEAGLEAARCSSRRRTPLPATIHNVTDETIKVPGRTIAARRWTLHLGGSHAELEMDVWTEGSRLLRLDIPTQMLSVMRDDIASVSARLVTLARPNDEEVSIPANGFSLAATISRPVAAAAPETAAAPGRKAGSGPAAGGRAGIGFGTDGSRRVRRRHSDLRAAGHCLRRRRLPRRALRRARYRPERRPSGIGDDRGIRGRRARGHHVPAETPRRRSEEDLA